MRDRLGRKTLQLHLFLTTAFRHGGRFSLPPFFAGERLSSAIPTGEGSLRLPGAINLLAVKYSTVFGVDMQSRKVSVFRSESLFGSSDPGPVDNMDYDDALDLIVTQYMHPEERRSVQDMLTREKVQERLNRAASFKVHCRILQDGVHDYDLLIARNGEDDHITSKRIYEKQLDRQIGHGDPADRGNAGQRLRGGHAEESGRGHRCAHHQAAGYRQADPHDRAIQKITQHFRRKIH